MSGNLAHDWAAERTPSDPSHAFPTPMRPGSPQDTRPSHITIAPTRAQRRARPRLVYALIAATGILVIITGQLLLSVATSQATYEIDGLESEATALSRTWQSLTVELDSVASPQNLAAHAESLGMVRNTNPSVFLRLSDGAVLGHPAAATQAAGSVIGAGGLVPNSLLNKEDVQAKKAQTTKDGAATKDGAVAKKAEVGVEKSQTGVPSTGAGAGSAVVGETPGTEQSPSIAIDLPATSAPGSGSTGSLVPLQGGLPAPQTH